MSRWLNRKTGRPHKLPHQLIVSLTSYPVRFNTLPLTLKCLLTQTVKPDRLILWIAYSDKTLLTDKILGLQEDGLEILYCDDIKSYKKIIPLLQIVKDAFIVTADDDVYYWPTWLEELSEEYSGDDREILCHNAHKILMTEAGQPLPYLDWKLNMEDNDASPLVFPTGLGGVMYPPNVFHPDVLETDLFMSLCPAGDDIWLYWMARRKGSRARKIGAKRRFVLWPGTQDTSLWKNNCLPDGNDAKVSTMVKKYGFHL
jgi:hypothetical protein